MDYISIGEAAEIWVVREEYRFYAHRGATGSHAVWQSLGVPKDAEKPANARVKAESMQKKKNKICLAWSIGL